MWRRAGKDLPPPHTACSSEHPSKCSGWLDFRRQLSPGTSTHRGPTLATWHQSTSISSTIPWRWKQQRSTRALLAGERQSCKSWTAAERWHHARFQNSQVLKTVSFREGNSRKKEKTGWIRGSWILEFEYVLFMACSVVNQFVGVSKILGFKLSKNPVLSNVFAPLVGEMIQFDPHVFHKWVETVN